MIDLVLDAKRWSDLKLPKDKDALRHMQRHLHPDVNHDPRAGNAFAKLKTLYDAPDYDFRVVAGITGRGFIDWQMKAGFEDRGGHAIDVSRTLESLDPKQSMFFAATTSTLRTSYGDGWWFFDQFEIDSRTSVWIAKRLGAAINILIENGIVHGNINVNTVVLNPKVHGLMLDGWWHSVPLGSKLALKPDAFVQPKLLRGGVTDAGTDIASAAMLLSETKVDKELKAVYTKHALNPTTPINFFNEVDTTAKRLYGIKWHELPVPNTTMI